MCSANLWYNPCISKKLCYSNMCFSYSRCKVKYNSLINIICPYGPINSEWFYNTKIIIAIFNKKAIDNLLSKIRQWPVTICRLVPFLKIKQQEAAFLRKLNFQLLYYCTTTTVSKEFIIKCPDGQMFLRAFVLFVEFALYQRIIKIFRTIVEYA